MKIEKLYPVCKDYIWGGTRLKDEYGKKTDKTPCAESWELSFHKDGLTCLENGETLAKAVTQAELGTNVQDFPFFPVLIKLIDAKQNLSVQVHPSDNYALKYENSFGKTEMWYIVEADEDAGIYLGFNRDVTKEEYQTAIEENRLTELLNFYKVKAGDCYFIPSGTIHAIAKGCLICEIQQNSNLTYRVFDYGRGRELHVEKALAVTTLKKHENIALQGDLLAVNKYFTVRKMHVRDEVFTADTKTFQCITCVNGQGEIDGKTVQKGDSFFVPAAYGKYTLKGDMEIVMTEIRKYYIGIDLGGTFIKGGIVDGAGNILVSDKTPTESEKGAEQVAKNIAALALSLMQRLGLTKADVVGIGMGVPGMIDSKAGNVIYSNNLNWKDFRIAETVEKLSGLPVKFTSAREDIAEALGGIEKGFLPLKLQKKIFEI